MLHTAKVLGSTSLWLVAILFMVEGTIEDSLALQSWSLLATGAAIMPTIWLIFDYNRSQLRHEILTILAEERGRAERLVQAIASEFARAELSDLDSRRSV